MKICLECTETLVCFLKADCGHNLRSSLWTLSIYLLYPCSCFYPPAIQSRGLEFILTPLHTHIRTPKSPKMLAIAPRESLLILLTRKGRATIRQMSIYLASENCNSGNTDADRNPDSVPFVGWKQGITMRDGGNYMSGGGIKTFSIGVDKLSCLG